MKYTVEQVEEIAKKLKAMPKIEKKDISVSKQETIKMLYSEIIDMQKRGYTLEQISEALTSDGIAVTTATLKSYLQRAKTDKDKIITKEVDKSKATFTPKPDSKEI